MPMVGGKKYPYTRKGVTAAKKASAASLREVQQKKNRASAGTSQVAANKKTAAVMAAIGRTSPNYWGSETIKSNRIQSKGTAVTRGGSTSSFTNVKASDALQGGMKKTRTPSTRMRARRAGDR